EANNLVSSAKEIAIALANDTFDATAREGAATEVEAIFSRLMALANSRQIENYIFSGYRTDTQALVSSANGVCYQGDQGAIDYQIDSFSRMTVNLSGHEVFLKPLTILGEEADLNPGLTGATLLADLHNGQGVDLSPGTFTVTDRNLGIVATIDVSAAVDINDVLTAINAQLAAAGITNLTATLGSEGNNILLDATPNGLISAATSLAVLNNGHGVDLEPGEIFVTDGAGINVTVDFSSATTIGDIINEFNAQLVAQGVSNVTMQINAAGTGLEIVDANAVPLGLRIMEVAEKQTTAADLGILGSIAPTLTGRDLEPTVNFKVEETTGTTATDLGIIGEFTADFSGNDLDPLLLATTDISSLNNGVGFDLGRVVVWQGDDRRVIDLSSPPLVTVQDVLDAFNNSGLDIIASVNAGGRGIQIANNDPTRSLTIEDESGARTAKDLDIFGSTDMMGTVLVLVNALRNDDAEGTALLLQNLDDAMNHLVRQRASVGAKAVRLETTQSRLVNLELTLMQQLSDVEDVDITKAVTDLATFENNYRASLLAAASVVQPSLLDFLK
ncbi:MAG: flagellin, partial [Candidatus Zixiibacteriota bacterium]